ncbi:ABC transporter substrate-binding protein [Blastococcus sp. SYSU D00695]
MHGRRRAAAGAACAAALVLAACGGPGEAPRGAAAGGGADASGATRTVRVGVLTSLSGAGAAAAQDAVRGTQARFDAYEQAAAGCAADLDLEIVPADDTSSAQGALVAAHVLVQQEDVFALIDVSAFFYGASTFLTGQAAHVPVIGGAWDGAQEWRATDDNLFASAYVPDYETVYTGTGEVLRAEGATTVAGVAHVGPSSQRSLDTGMASAAAAGLRRGYEDASVPIGSADLDAVVLGILESRADAVYTTTTPDTALALVSALHRAGWEGTFLSPTGYGADLPAVPPAAGAGRGVVLSTDTTPVEAETPATQALRSALREAGNPSGVPGFYEGQGWLAADLLLHGLERAGCDADRAALVDTLQRTDDWDGGGLYPRPVPQSTTAYAEQCSFYVRLEGEAFVPLHDGLPVCGTPVG